MADDWSEFFYKNVIAPLFYPIFLHEGDESRITADRQISRMFSVRSLIKRRLIQWIRRNSRKFERNQPLIPKYFAAGSKLENSSPRVRASNSD